MSRFAHTVAWLTVLGCAFLICAGAATAGSYFVYACSSYGNTAAAFSSWTDSDHMNTANECMQPAPNGGYRSLEINNPSKAAVFQGHTAHWIANSPSPQISIVGAYTPPNSVLADCLLHTDGFTAQFFWAGGAQSIDRTGTCNTSQGYGYGTGIDASFGPSSYFGWGATCSYKSTCSTSSIVDAVLGVQGIRLTAQENDGPGLIADGPDNLWYQASHWVRGGGWPVGFTAMDPSGVCATDLWINGLGTGTDNSNDTNPDTASFTQCWPNDVVVGTLDTTSYDNGPLTITYAARNAAGVLSAPSQTLRIDNSPVTLSLSTTDDPDPNVWVNHAVHVVAAASAGPSGLGGTSCSTNNGASYAYPGNGITLNGTGIWKVSCSSWNNALDVGGRPANSPPESVNVHIDETPPSLAFAPQSPADPQAVVVQAADGQSGVAGGQIEMRQAADGNWSSLATQFDGSHLRARFDDATLPPGQWLVQASSCDHAGNCSSTQETLTLPVRIRSVSSAGFVRLTTPHGAVSRCSRGSVKRSGRRHRRCDKAELVLLNRDRVGFGKTARLRGLLTTANGAPIARARISILTAPENGSSAYSQVASATTGSEGLWTAALPAGPSRIVAAVYGGSSTIQPSESWANLIVPASLRVIRVWPRHVPWGGKVHIEARLEGGYLPSDGALVRLRLGYGRAKITYGVKEHVGGNGVFEVTNTFGPGPSSLKLHYWLQECTLPEGDYPFSPACGPRNRVTVGGLAG